MARATRTTTGTRTSSPALREAIGPDDKLAYSDMRIVTAKGEVISDTYWSRRRNNHTNFASLLIANTVTGAAASMFRRDVLDYALPFPQEVDEQRHDHWIAIVAMALGDIALRAPARSTTTSSTPTPRWGTRRRTRARRRARASAGDHQERRRARWMAPDVLPALHPAAARRAGAPATLLGSACAGQAKGKVSDQSALERLRHGRRLAVAALPARPFGGASETMQRDGTLARAIAWLRISRVRARLARRAAADRRGRRRAARSAARRRRAHATTRSRCRSTGSTSRSRSRCWRTRRSPPASGTRVYVTGTGCCRY